MHIIIRFTLDIPSTLSVFTILSETNKSNNILSWRDQTEAVYKMGGVPPPHIDLQDYWEYAHDIWGGFSTRLEVFKNGSEISVDPPKHPLWASKGATEAKNGSKFTHENLVFS